MLPPALKALREHLAGKQYSERSFFEDRLLEDLQETDDALNNAKRRSKDLTEGIEKKSYPTLLGPRPGSCPTCGRSY